jgi:hypothetical protein
MHRVVYKPENGNGGSMGAIAVDDVFRAVAELLAETGSPSMTSTR